MLKTAIVNMKGGVGKTTTAVNAALGLAGRGHRVLLIDMDPQGNVAHYLKIRAGQATILDLLADGVPVDTVVRRGVREGLDVIPSSNSAFGLESRLSSETLREKIFSRRLKGVDGYDFVFVDTSPAMSLLTVNTLLYVDRVLLTVSMDQMAIIGAVQSLAGLKKVLTAFEATPREVTVLPTMHHSGTTGSRVTLEALRQDPDLGPYLLPFQVRQDVKVGYAAAAGTSIWEFDNRSRAAEDYTTLLDWFEQSREVARG